MLFARFFLFISLLFSPIFAEGFLYDENRILNKHDSEILEAIANELKQKAQLDLKIYLYEQNLKKWESAPSEIILLVDFSKRKFDCVLGTSLQNNNLNIQELEQKYLYPHFKIGNYSRGLLQFTYHLSNEILEKQGEQISIDVQFLEEKNALSFLQWIFIFAVILFLLYAFKSKKKNTKKEIHSFDGRFGGHF